MARGWESKSVEQQQDAAQSQQKDGNGANPQRAEHMRALRGLELSRSRVLHQLENASNPRHREMLQAALADLERKISEINQ
jgi:ribosomal protein L20